MPMSNYRQLQWPTFAFLCVGVIITILLVALVSNTNQPGMMVRSAENLKDNEKAVEEFKKKFARIPRSFVELKLFGLQYDQKVYGYDSSGESLEYIPLGQNQFLFRAFGEGDKANQLIRRRDLVLTQMDDSQSASYLNIAGVQAHQIFFYCPWFLSGLASPDRKFVAQLFVDPVGGRRRLVVTSRNQRRKSVLVAAHEGVEEFLWMPDSDAILFSAAEQQNFSDGIFIWNIRTDEIIKLDWSRNEKLAKLMHSDMQVFSLMGFDHHNKHLYFLSYPRDRNALSPVQFFSPRSFWQVTYEKKDDVYTLKDPKQASPFFDEKVFWKELRRVIQESTDAGLKYRGRVDDVISSWQEVVDGLPKGQIKSYVLWYLILMYHKAATLMPDKSESQQALNAFALEIATALSRDQFSPLYLRYMARWYMQNHESFNAEKFELIEFDHRK